VFIIDIFIYNLSFINLCYAEFIKNNFFHLNNFFNLSNIISTIIHNYKKKIPSFFFFIFFLIFNSNFFMKWADNILKIDKLLCDVININIINYKQVTCKNKNKNK